MQKLIGIQFLHPKINPPGPVTAAQHTECLWLLESTWLSQLVRETLQPPGLKALVTCSCVLPTVLGGGSWSNLHFTCRK